MHFIKIEAQTYCTKGSLPRTQVVEQVDPAHYTEGVYKPIEGAGQKQRSGVGSLQRYNAKPIADRRNGIDLHQTSVHIADQAGHQGGNPHRKPKKQGKNKRRTCNHIGRNTTKSNHQESSDLHHSQAKHNLHRKSKSGKKRRRAGDANKGGQHRSQEGHNLLQKNNSRKKRRRAGASGGQHRSQEGHSLHRKSNSGKKRRRSRATIECGQHRS